MRRPIFAWRFATRARDGACILFIVRDTLGTKIRGGLVEERKDEGGKKEGSRSSRLASGYPRGYRYELGGKIGRNE